MRGPSVALLGATRQRGRRGRSAGHGWPPRAAGRSALAGSCRVSQSSPASSSALRCPSTSAHAARSARSLALTCRPWRRSTDVTCASALCQVRRSLGSTGRLAASRLRALVRMLLRAYGQLGKQRDSCAQASVAAASASSVSLACAVCDHGLLSARPLAVVAAAAAGSVGAVPGSGSSRTASALESVLIAVLGSALRARSGTRSRACGVLLGRGVRPGVVCGAAGRSFVVCGREAPRGPAGTGGRRRVGDAQAASLKRSGDRALLVRGGGVMGAPVASVMSA